MTDLHGEPDNVSAITMIDHGAWLLTSGGTFEKVSAVNANNVTASVSLNATISFGMMSSILDDTMFRFDLAVEALDQDSPITSRTSGCCVASSVNGVTSLT